MDRAGRYLFVILPVLSLVCDGYAEAGPKPADPFGIVLPYEWVGNIDESRIVREPSGIVYHPARGTLFVVGDEGDIYEFKTDGTLVNKKLHKDRKTRRDYEGITVNPATGLLYLAVEGEERILEVDPDTLLTKREFTIGRKFDGKTVMKKGDGGIEAITFVPDAKHPEGGIFFVSNQSFTLDNPEDISAIFEVEAPLKTGKGQRLKARILRSFPMGVIDVSGLYYDATKDHLYAVSDATNTFWELSRDCKVLRGYAFPGMNQEGITLDPDGYLYIAQDSGGIIKIKWLSRN